MLQLWYKDLLAFDIVDDPSKSMFFLFGVRKSGSSILNNIVHAIARLNDVHYVDIAGRFFQGGIPVSAWQRDVELNSLLRPGNIYAGFRNFPVGLAADARLLKSRKLLMVRDPRDVLVSLYYSNAYSHSVPTAGPTREEMLRHRQQALESPIDAYVLREAPPLKRTLLEYGALVADGTLKVLRYEDVILDKRRLIDEICRFFSWQVSPKQIGQILGWADVIPDRERPTEFIRKVVPGDHIQKLAPETIAKLDEIFAGQLCELGYR